MWGWGTWARSGFVVIGIWLALSQAAYAEWDDNEINERAGQRSSKIVQEENNAVSTRPPPKRVAADPIKNDPIGPPRRQMPPPRDEALTSWWSPEAYTFSIGYEKAGTSTAALGGDNIVWGVWFPGVFGFDLYVGYTRDAGTTAVATSLTETGVAVKTRTSNSRYSGVSGSQNFTVGLGPKFRLYQNSWFQFNLGLLMGYTAPYSTESTVGQVTETIPNIGAPTTKTITETSFGGSAGYGTSIANTKGAFSVGPRLGTEFYLKWFPHLALGFATGILTTFGGDTVTTTTTRIRTVTFIDGVEQDDLSGTDGPTTTTTTTKAGTRVGTFGIGGTNFQFTGIFTIRYVF